MTIVMIDTITLCGNTLHDKEGSQPDGKIDQHKKDHQLKFIEHHLKKNKYIKAYFVVDDYRYGFG